RVDYDWVGLFFFQAEDGIRDFHVTGVQTCALPILATDDWRMVVASPHIRAVDICTPNHLHAEMAMAALEAGKHVLVEAPMALTLRDADALLKTAARKGLMLVPVHRVRIIGPYAALVAPCQHGQPGQLA